MFSVTTKKTIYEWNKLGYRIKKGQKAAGKLAGQSLFSYSQVYEVAAYGCS